MIRIEDKKKCCGCTACYSICGEHAITMELDDEGFMYPRIDAEKCIDCRACEKVCPYIKYTEISEKYHSIQLAVQYKDEGKREASTAGGAFSLIADYVLEQDGIVYGVGYDNMIVCHKQAGTEEDLAQMRGSKYVQSTLNDTFQEIFRLLKKKKTVLFVGTPCQVHGLKNCTGENPYLITMDLLCLGVSSPGIFGRWVNYLEEKYEDKVKTVQFRNKRFGYAVTNVRVIFDDDRILEQRYDSKAYAKTFFSGYNVRPSCYKCEFRKKPRVSDFTVGDCIQIGKYSRTMDDDKGTTSLWVHTETAKQILKKVKERAYWKEIESNGTNVIGGPAKQMTNPYERPAFFEDAFSMPYDVFIRKWMPDNMTSICASIVRISFNKLPFGRYIFRLMRKKQGSRFQEKICQIDEGSKMEKQL